MPFDFSLFYVMFFLIFGLVFTVIIIVIIRGLIEWNKSNNSPVLTVEATVVGKRMDVSHYYQNHDNMMMNNSHTTYYVTFEVESKDRIELVVSGKEYGQLVEKDFGKLTFQGTRYKGFVRN